MSWNTPFAASETQVSDRLPSYARERLAKRDHEHQQIIISFIERASRVSFASGVVRNSCTVASL